MNPEAIVVGAGPAGASVAYHLARRGRRVLLIERSRFPRDKSCGDGLTRFTTRQLSEMGVLGLLPEAAASCGVRIRMRGRSHRDFRYPDSPGEPRYGMVVPRLILDHAICRRAELVGAELWQDTLALDLLWNTQGAVVGVRIKRNGEHIEVRAPIVVAADGASSRLARQAGLISTEPGTMGYAIRGYYDRVEGLSDLLEIYMPLFDATDRYLLPSYGWAFPTGPDSANIGIGLVHRAHGANVRELFQRFLAELRHEPRFRSARQCGEWKGAPLRFDFRPERCVAPGLILVGDAAGLISPFTGEGIGYALASGKLAAEAVDAAFELYQTHLDISAYPAALSRRFTGYFEAGRESTYRYQLMWHLLESTFQNERPLFRLCRRAALFPEGIGESYVQEAFEDIGPVLSGMPGDMDGSEGGHGDGAASELAMVRTDLLAVGEQLLGTVRGNWPFLAKMISVDETVSGIPFRPALLLLLSGRVAEQRRSLLVTVGAAVEMGFIGSLAHASVCEEESPSGSEHRAGSSANWGNMLALMVGDFLLSNAYASSAQIAARISSEIALALSTSSEGYLHGLRNAYNTDLTPTEHLEILGRKAGTLFELPCRLGALLSGAQPRIIGALASYGRHLGLAYQLIDDVVSSSGRTSELGSTTGAAPADGLYSFSIIHSLHTSRREPIKRALSLLRAGEATLSSINALTLEAGGVQASLDQASRAVRRALTSLQSVPDGNTKTWLAKLANFLGNRASSLSGPAC